MTTGRMNRLVRQIMASSDVCEGGYSGPSMPYIRELVFRVSSIVVIPSIFAALNYNWSQGLHTLVVVESVLLLFLTAHLYLLLVKNRRLLSPVLLLLISFSVLVATICGGIHEYIYWCYAFPAALYLLVDPRESLFLNIGWWGVSSVLALMYLEPLQALSFIGAQGATCFFLHVLFTIFGHHEEQLRQLIIVDPLTNALNRRAMVEVMEEALSVHKRYNVVTSIIMIDIDHFKSINDTFGHREGDLVLQNLVTALSVRLRKTDRVCRYGGEEFVLVLPRTDQQKAVQLAEDICRDIRTNELTEKRNVTVSCGVAESRTGDTVSHWLHRGDMALYEAKRLGRNCVVNGSSLEAQASYESR